MGAFPLGIVGLLTDRQVPNRFQRRGEPGQQEGNQKRQIKGPAQRPDPGNGEHRSLVQGLHIESSQRATHIGSAISDAQPDEHTIEPPDALSPYAEPNHNAQRQAGDQYLSDL